MTPALYVQPKISEQQHFSQWVYPYLRHIFFPHSKPYKIQYDCHVGGTKKRPDFACVVADIPFLNFECKPSGTKILLKLKDFIKVHLRAKKSINQQLTSKGGPGKAVLFTNMGTYALYI